MTIQSAACVLPAVFPDARRIALDVAGLLRRLVERRAEEQQRLRPAHDERRADRIHRAFGEPLRHRAGQHRPRLRNRVDGALVVLRRAQRASIVVVAAPVPFAVPREFELRRQAARGVRVGLRPRRLVARGAQRDERLQHGVDEEAGMPGAFAAPRRTHLVHAVVPVARAEERQPVGAGGEPGLRLVAQDADLGAPLVRPHLGRHLDLWRAGPRRRRP